MVRRLLEVLGTRGPCTIDELANLLPELDRRVYHDPDLPELGYSRLGTRLLPALCANGTLVRARPRGGWRSESFAYAALSNWLPEPLDLEIGRDEALRQVALAYLRAFGPATVGDLHHWLGGFSRRQVVAALLELGPAIARVQIAELPGEYLLWRTRSTPWPGSCPASRGTLCPRTTTMPPPTWIPRASWTPYSESVSTIGWARPPAPSGWTASSWASGGPSGVTSA
jgi:hypothetical protein